MGWIVVNRTKEKVGQMEELRKESINSSFPRILVLVLIIAGLAYMVFSGVASKSEKTIWDLAEIDYNSEVSGELAEGKISRVYGQYAEMTENEKVIAKDYLIDVDGSHFIGVRIYERDFEKMDLLVDATYLYLNGLLSDEELEENSFEVSGRLHEMSDEVLGFYHEAIGYNLLDEEMCAMFLPVYFDTAKVSDGDSLFIFFVIILVLVVAYLAYFIYKVFSGGYQASVKKYIEKSANPELAKQKVDDLIANGKAIYGVIYNQDFICIQEGLHTYFWETKDIVWLYKQVTKTKNMGITVSTEQGIVLATVGGARKCIVNGSDEQLIQVIESLQPVCPGALIGYTEQLNTLYERDRQRFLALKYNQMGAEE